VWTLLPSGDAQEKHKKYAIIARLPELIQQEMAVHELPGVNLDGIIATLDATYLALLKGEDLNSMTVTALNTTAVQTGIDVDISHTLIEHARAIECGQWFLLTPEEGAPLRIRLAQKDDTSNHYLFVNRAGLKALDASIEQLAYHLVNGRL